MVTGHVAAPWHNIKTLITLTFWPAIISRSKWQARQRMPPLELYVFTLMYRWQYKQKTQFLQPHLQDGHWHKKKLKNEIELQILTSNVNSLQFPPSQTLNESVTWHLQYDRYKKFTVYVFHAYNLAIIFTVYKMVAVHGLGLLKFRFFNGWRGKRTDSAWLY